MTEEQPTSSPRESEATPEGTQPPAGPENGPEPPTETDPETFPATYVRELRQEAARHRAGAKKADDLTRLLVQSYAAATGRLHDSRDLAYDPAFLDEDGMPDPEKVSAGVQALIKERPHLAKIRPVGDVGQGSHQSAPDDLSAFGSFLRA